MKCRFTIAGGLAGLLALIPALAAAQRVETSRVYAEIPGDPLFRVFSTPVPGSNATLKRDSNGVDVAIDSSRLPEGAYTLWIRVFNRPDLCTGGEGVEGSLCSRGADIAPSPIPCVPDEQGQSSCSVFWIASFFVGPDGRTHLSARVNRNEWRGFVILGADVAGTVSFEDEADLFRLGRQITRVSGNCEGLPGDLPPETCFDAQLAFFPPSSR